MKYLRTVKGFTRVDQIRNKDIRYELGISPLSEKITEYRNKWKAYLQRMEHTAFHYRQININHPENEKQVYQEDDGKRPEQEIHDP
jgi:dihydroorotate dehydrogenase